MCSFSVNFRGNDSSVKFEQQPDLCRSDIEGQNEPRVNSSTTMEYQQCHRHVKPQWKQQQEDWLESRLPCSCIKGTDMRVKRVPRYYQHHAALTLTLTTITVLLSLHLVLLGDAVSASADVDPQETDKVLLPTLDGNHVAVTAGYTIFNASQMYKYRNTNMIRQPYQQEGQLNMKQVSALNIAKGSNNQGKQWDQLLNKDVSNDKQNVNNEQFKGRYVQEQDDRESPDLSKLHESNKGLEYRENEPPEKLQQDTEGRKGVAQAEGHANRQLQYFGTTRPPKRRPPYPPRPSTKMKKQVSWFEGSRTFALRASVDARLLIRHSPVPEQGSPWPLPQHYFPEPTVFTLNSKSFRFYAAGESCDILTFAFKRIYRNIFGADAENYEDNDLYPAWLYGQQQQQQQQNPSDPIKILHMNVTLLRECAKYPSLEMDESYDLEVKRTGASIIAREIWGALRGLETFSQLIYRDEQGKYFVNKTSINDFPRFPHRGILLDTARHFLSKNTIIKNLEAMAQNKMNVFHWHMVDDQSFPFQSKTFPNITKMGAYDPVNAIYTHEDIAEIIEQARLRGIRVIPEFDSPGHTFSWGYGQDYLLTPCYDYRNQPDGFFGPVNPILKATYNFLQRLFIEILAVFPDKYVHLGGDEVPFDCWASNPHLMNFIRRNNLTDIRDLLSLYERKLLDIVSTAGKNRESGTGYITWQEVVDNGVRVKPDTIVQVWMGDAADVERITSQGLRVIYSTCWYLDYISYGMDWDKYYRCEQISSHLEAFGLQNESLLIGGEACLWTEYADDENIMQRLWPRASAAAERLWSNKKVLDEIAAAPRIEEQRCRMIRRGIDVGVLSGPGHCPELGNGSPQRPPIEIVPPPGLSERHLSGNWPETEPVEVRASYPQVYVVDMNAMYLVPVLIVVCICCLTLLSLAQDSAKNKIVAILTYPVAGGSRRSIRGLLYIFMSFALIWCIWTAPIWMHSWEGGHKPKTQRSQYP